MFVEVWVWGLNILGKALRLLKQGSWSQRLGLLSLRDSQKVKQPEILGCSRPRKNWERKKEKKRNVSAQSEMSLLISRVRGLKESAHGAGMGWV